MFVIIKGNTYETFNKEGFLALNLSKLKISSILEIEGLENLKDLEFLDLSKNNLSRIEGLEHLTRLRVLDLSRNKISKIEGLVHLTKLKRLILSRNRIEKFECLENLRELEDLIIYQLNYEINELEGLEDLVNLRNLKIQNGGKLYKWLRKGNCGGISISGELNDPQACVKYCQENLGKQLDGIEGEIFKMFKDLEKM